MKRRILILIAGLLVFGAIRLPIEQQLSTEYAASHFGKARLDLEMRQRVGQTAFLAALSGFRSIVADMLWIRAYTAFEHTQWGRMNLLLDTVTTLQPRNVLFWDLASWHMAYNASASAINDRTQESELLRRKAQREYFEVGRDFLKRGIENNPDKPELFVTLGNMERDKFEDPCASAEAYAAAAKLPGVMPYVKRFAAYEFARCGRNNEEAYRKLLALYEMGPEERKPTLLTLLGELEQKLQIPDEQRIVKEPTTGL